MKLRLPKQAEGQRWPLLIGFGAVAALLVIFYGLHLGSLVPASAAELGTMEELRMISSVGHDLMLAPYKLLAWLFIHMPGDDLTNLRLASVVLALASAGLFYGLARRWHGRLIGTGATILFALSSWMLSTGRHGAGFIMLTFSVLLLLATAVQINKAEDSRHAGKAIIAFAAAIAISLVTPGGIWFVIATLAVVGKQLLGHAKLASNTTRFGAGAIVLIGVTMLALACLSGSQQLHQALGIPANLPGLIIIAKQALLSVSGFVARGPEMPSLWLAHTPLLDVAASVMLLLGAMLYARHLRNSRTRLLLVFIGVGVVLTALNGAIALSYLIPIVYLIIASGLAYFHHQWKKVFPRNPVAETVAIVSLSAVMLVVIGFHTQRYFVAWKNSPTTVQQYKQAVLGDEPSANIPYLLQ